MIHPLDPAFMQLPREQKRLLMYLGQSGECWYCGCPMAFYPLDPHAPAPPDNYTTVEHITPMHYGSRNRRSKVELNKPFNKLLACQRCNHRRGDRPLTTFIGELRELGFTRGIVARIRHLVDDHRPAPWQASEFEWYMIQALAHPRRPGDSLKRLPSQLEVALLPEPTTPIVPLPPPVQRLSRWRRLWQVIQQLGRIIAWPRSADRRAH